MPVAEIRQVTPDNIPEELRNAPQWVAWRVETRANGRVNKIPVNVKTGSNASTADPNTWSSYENVLNYYQNADGNGIAGIGFVFTECDPYFGIDLDDCRDPETNEVTEEATAILSELDTYSEISPSDKGIKAFARGNLPNGAVTGEGIEIYDRGRFFCVTGGWLGAYSGRVEDRQDQVNRLCERLNRETSRRTGAGQQQGWQDEVIQGVDAGSRHRTALQLAGRWARKGFSDAEIAHFIMTWNGNNHPPKEELSDPDSTELRDIVRYVTGEGTPEISEDLLEFPDVINGAAGQFANLYSRYLEVPKSFLMMSYLTCLGSALGNMVTAASELNPQPRLYTVLLGASADERKSTALLKTTALFKSALENFNTSWGVSSAEGLQTSLRSSPDTISPILQAPPDRISTQLLIFDEFKTFVSKSKIKSSVLLPCVNTLFESNIYETRTKKSPLILDNAYLSILAASTIQTYETIWDARFIDIGFVNRLFLVPGKATRQHSFPPRIPEAEKIRLGERLRRVIRHAGCHSQLEITPEARELFHQWYLQLERSVHSKRLDTYSLRLMILLAVNEFRNAIDEEVVDKVMTLMNWQLLVRKRFDPVDSDNEIAKMEQKIRKVLISGPKTDSQLKQRTNANRAGLWIFDTAKKNLKKADEIILNKKTKKWEGVE